MWTLSGFIDEISNDFKEQCEVAAGLGLRYVEVRSAWGNGTVVVAGAGDGEVITAILTSEGIAYA